MLLGHLRSWPGPNQDLEMRAALLLLGAGVDRGRGTLTPPDPDHGGALHPPAQANTLPRGGSDTSGKGMGPTRVAGKAPPGQHRTLQDVAQRGPLPLGGVGRGGRGRTTLANTAAEPIWSGNEDAGSDDNGSPDSGQERSDAAPGVQLEFSAEGYVDDTYMLAIHLLSLLTMLVAPTKWLKLTGEVVNAEKSLAFSATNKVRRKLDPLEATLDGM